MRSKRAETSLNRCLVMQLWERATKGSEVGIAYQYRYVLTDQGISEFSCDGTT